MTHQHYLNNFKTISLREEKNLKIPKKSKNFEKPKNICLLFDIY